MIHGGQNRNFVAGRSRSEDYIIEKTIVGGPKVKESPRLFIGVFKRP
jgi:hypothetical protein